MAEQVKQRTYKSEENDDNNPGGFMPTKDMFSISDIVENDTGKNPVKNTEKYKLQYPLNIQVFGPFRS